MKAVMSVHEDLQRIPSPPDDDTGLVARFRDGDERAFDMLVHRYRGRLIRAASLILHSHDEAEDMAQEAFVKAYYNRDSFRGDSSFYTWIYRILYNLCLSALRRRKILSFLSYDRDDYTFEMPSEAAGPDEMSERSEIADEVRKALTRLPGRQRSVFVMKQLDGLKFREIAEITGITEGAAKASYFHAVRKLQESLKQFGDDYHEM